MKAVKRWSVVRQFGLLVFLLVSLVLSGCSTTIPFNKTYQGKISPTDIAADGYVVVESIVLDAKGTSLKSGYINSMNSSLKNALEKHHIASTPEDGLEQYRLLAKVVVPPEKALWRAKPVLSKNLGMAAIPFAGAFTPRFYTVSSDFNVDFRLFHGDILISHEDYDMSDKKEIKVSNRKRAVESAEAAIRLWEKERDEAIERFFLSLHDKFPARTAQN